MAKQMITNLSICLFCGTNLEKASENNVYDCHECGKYNGENMTFSLIEHILKNFNRKSINERIGKDIRKHNTDTGMPFSVNLAYLNKIDSLYNRVGLLP